MGYKRVCIKCRTAFSQGNDYNNTKESTCSTCGDTTLILHQKFKPPKKSEINKWKVVQFLIENGFDYSTYWEPLRDKKGNPFGAMAYGALPETMKDAKSFILKVKSDYPELSK